MIQLIEYSALVCCLTQPPLALPISVLFIGLQEVVCVFTADAATILAEEATKQRCRRFLNTGNCDYGDACRYSHLTPERAQYLQTQGGPKSSLFQCIVKLFTLKQTRMARKPVNISQRSESSKDRPIT